MFDPSNPFAAAGPSEDVPAPDFKQQLYQRLAQSMQPAAPVDTSAQDNQAADLQRQALLQQGAVQLGAALAGVRGGGSGDNALSTQLNDQAKDQMGKALMAKKQGADQELKRQELVQRLGAEQMSSDGQDSRQAANQKFLGSEHSLDRELDLKKLYENIASRKALAAQAGDTKAQTALDKEELALSKMLDPSVARAGLKGNLANQVVVADRAKALIYNPDGTLKNLNPEQMAEAATAWARLVSGQNVTADAAIQRLVPHTESGQTADIKQWLTNEPQGANQQEFLKLMAETIDRENDVSQNSLKGAQAQTAAGFRKLKESRPDAYYNLLKTYGIGKDDLDETGNYKPKASEKHEKSLAPEDKQALDWADANPNDPRAAQIKSRLGK